MIIDALGWAAGKGRAFLVIGLLGGLTLPGIAAALQPWLPHFVAFLLFLAALRIGPRQAIGSLSDAPKTLAIALLYQLALPLLLIGLAILMGVSLSPLVVALVLMTSAPSISGAPPFSVMLGADPAPALRLLVLGTAVLPLTILPVLALLPALGEASAVFDAAFRLLIVIGLAVALAFLFRGAVLPHPTARTLAALDGASVVALSVVVVGLMSAVGPALRETPLLALGWLGVACAANFGLQILAHMLLGQRPEAIPFSIIAGNRNVALFLVALPPEITTPLLLFIGCYQIPMYLTPIAMRWLYTLNSP